MRIGSLPNQAPRPCAGSIPTLKIDGPIIGNRRDDLRSAQYIVLVHDGGAGFQLLRDDSLTIELEHDFCDYRVGDTSSDTGDVDPELLTQTYLLRGRRS